MPGRLNATELDDVHRALKRAVRRDPSLERIALPDLAPLCQAFNLALDGDDDGALAETCVELTDAEVSAASVIGIATHLAETFADEIGTASGAFVSSLISTLGELSALLATQLVAVESTAARRDVLTGLENRRAWDESLAAGLAAGVPLDVAMIDLDGLKAVNDGEGHDAGDELLKGFAAALNAILPERARGYRFGGDEFAVLVTHPVPGAIEVQLAQLANTGEVASFSFGVAKAPTEATNAAELVKLADDGMYAMKAEHHAAAEGVAPITS